MVKYRLGDNMIQEFYDTLSDMGLQLSEKQEEQFRIYFKELVEWNKKMNLTGITDEYGVYIKHFLDSIYLVEVVDLKGLSLLDVGSGAGFPSIPLKILYPELNITIIDALSKRINFLTHLSNELGIESELIHGRVEEFDKKNSFDVVTARAVANLQMLSELCIPFVRVKGLFLAMKGPKYEQELFESKNAFEILGGELDSVYKYTIAGESHNVLKIKKVSETSNKYPRRFNKIKSKPL